MNITLTREVQTFKPSKKVIFFYCSILFTALMAKFLLVYELDSFEVVWKSAVLFVLSIIGYLYCRRATTLYTLSHKEISGIEGIFSKKTTRIPLARITNYEIKASLLDRLLGLVSIYIDTPGGDNFELKLLDLDKTEADAIAKLLSELIFTQQNHTKNGSVSFVNAIAQNSG